MLGQGIIVKPYLQDVEIERVSIMWEADSSGNGNVIWGESPFNLEHSTASLAIIGSGDSRIHTVLLDSLGAGMKYYYRVLMEGGQMSNMYSFRTLFEQSAERNSQFMAISDMQRDGNFPNKFKEIIEQGIIPISLAEVGDSLTDLEGILIPGDLVPTGGSYFQWKDYFFAPSDSLTPHVPLYPVLGNHEYIGGGQANFKKYFKLPLNGVPSLLEECWYKDISNVRIIGLNSNSNLADQNLQLDWLSEVLDSACSDEYIDFVFAQLHHPFKSELWTPGENDFTGKVIDSLEAFTENCNKASIHFFGHTHAYSRGQSRDHKHLWINVATAGGAIDNWGEFPNADYEEFVKSQDEYGFVYMNVVAGVDPMFTLKRYSRGDQDTLIDNELTDELSILNTDIAPAKPVNLYPAEGGTITTFCMKLKASEFYGIDDSHQAAHWQIADSLDFSESLLSDQWNQSENYYFDVNLQEDDDLTDAEFSESLSNGEYFWRVRYRNQNLEWSDWSNPTSFFIENTVDTVASNLVLNAGAEDGVDYWVGDIESLENGECNSVLPFEGNFNFAVGGVCQNESNIGIASQNIDLSDYTAQIDNDNVSLSFGAFMRDFSGSDVPEMYVELYSNGMLIETSATISNATAVWTYVSNIINVPSAVDECKVVLRGIRNSGSDNDSYFDNISVILLENLDCSTCLGKSNTDNDADGFCDDLDCDDTNADIHPGSIELCNNLDDNCDGLADYGMSVQWTGAGDNVSWGDSLNWDQQFLPLACQHVIIDNTANVLLDGDYECFSLFLGGGNLLQINSESNLIINSQSSNTIPSASIYGTLLINGRCEIKKSGGIGFEIYGILINNNRLNLKEVADERILIRSGGRFDNLGNTVLK